MKPTNILRSPATVETGAPAQGDSDPSAIASWMRDLPPVTEMSAANEPTTGKDDPHGNGPGNTRGNSAPGGDSHVKSAVASAPADQLPAASGAKADKLQPGPDAAKSAKGPDGPVEEKWPRSSADWEKFKTVRKERESALQKEIELRETKLKELASQLQGLQDNAQKSAQGQLDHAELERLKGENEEYSKRLQVLDVTQHPKFQAYFDNKINAKINLAKKIVGAERAPLAERILKLPDTEEYHEVRQARIEELVNELDPLAQGRFADILNSMDEIAEERNTEIRRASEHKATLAGQQKDSLTRASTDRAKLVEDVVRKLQDKSDPNGLAVYQVREGDDQWNGRINQTIDTAKRLLTGQGFKTDDIVRAAFHAAALPTILSAYQTDMAQRDAQIAKLNAQVKELSAAQPTKGQGSANGEASRGTTITPDMNPMEAARAFTRGLWQDTEG